jgi:hypothetical protein
MEHWEIVNSGRIVVSNTPEELWENAVDYFAWCDMNPIVSKITITAGKGTGDQVNKSSRRPYSIKGLCLHCGILEEYIRDVRSIKDRQSLYYSVVSKILYIIYIQNLEMATIGEFNPIFVAKVLNMEKDDVPNNPVKIHVVQGLPELSKSENEILEKLESENGKL